MPSSSLGYRNGCVAYNPDIPISYGYKPSLAAGVVFCVLFGLSMVLHVVQSVWKRNWWSFVFSIGAMVELLGWAGRAWSSQCVYNNTAFLMQISTLIIAPTFFTAGIYIILGRLITMFGRHTSPLTPYMYLWIFCTCDVVSLVVQAIGGGMASGAYNTANGNTKPGTDVMVAGIVFQMASITVFVYFFTIFLKRTRNMVFTRKINILMAATTLSVMTIYTRSIYRTIELIQGWSGYLITHQRYFIALDGSMMFIAVFVFNVVHPAWFLDTPAGLKAPGAIQTESSEHELHNQHHNSEAPTLAGEGAQSEPKPVDSEEV